MAAAQCVQTVQAGGGLGGVADADAFPDLFLESPDDGQHPLGSELGEDFLLHGLVVVQAPPESLVDETNEVLELRIPVLSRKLGSKFVQVAGG